MGQKDTPRQPSGLSRGTPSVPTALERQQQSERDKKMGIFRKTRSKTKGATAQKKQPEIKKKPTRVAEFEFKHGFEVKPGEVIQYSGRQYGKSISVREEMIRLIQSTPPKPNPSADWRKTAGMGKLKFVVEMIYKKHGVRIEFQSGRGGDYVEFFSRGKQKQYRMSMTEVHVADPGKIIDRLETALDLSNSRVQTGNVKIPEQNPTESWAENWARENQ